MHITGRDKSQEEIKTMYMQVNQQKSYITKGDSVQHIPGKE